MLKAALIGLGAMGSGHLNNYHRLMKEGKGVKLVAICDVDPKRLYGEEKAELNIATDDGGATETFDYRRYLDMDEMLEKEELDYVDIVLPTFLHAPVAIKCMKRGLHVLCEKPMSLNPELCQQMIDCSRETGKKLMIAQCLRFWPAYEYLKSVVDSGKYGKVVCANFFRGGPTPMWSWENWLLTKERSGGCVIDQHVHDVDTINWIFGKPDRVVTSARRVFDTSYYDACATTYFYDDLGAVITAQDDWTINGEFKFTMNFRVNFEKGVVVWNGGDVEDIPHDGKAFTPQLDSDDGYYREMVYFINAVTQDTPTDRVPLESTKNTIALACCELQSADNKGMPVDVKF